MKKLLLVFILVPCLCFSQTDSLRKKKVGWQLSFPFEAGLSYYLPKAHKTTSEFGHLLNNREVVGTRIQVGSFQLQLFDRFFIEAAVNFDKTGFKSGSGLKELQERHPDYFIEGKSKYGESEGSAEGYNQSSLSYFRFGAGYNIVIKPLTYLKPYAAFNFGKGSLPASKYVFKEYTSNNFFINEYSYEKLKTTGFNIGICYSHYLLSDEMKNFPVYGIKIEYSSITIKGQGKITQSGLYQSTIESFVPVKENFQYVSLGVFIGLTSAKDKRLK